MKATTPAAKRPLWRRKFIVGASVFVALLTGVSVLIVAELPSLAAGGLLHPRRRHVAVAAPANCDNATFAGAGVRLEGWRCRATGARRGTVVYLHGIADNRASAVGAIDTFSRQGFDVVAYDSRGHGESTGDICTYGHFEQRDLRRVLDTVAAGPIVLVGTSLGAAVAIQEAADDPRVTAIVAAEVFADLRTVAGERAPLFLTSGVIRRAFLLAEERGGFEVDAVSPVRAAARIRVPVLLIHGSADTLTGPEHAKRVYAALAGPKRLILVQGAKHNQSLLRSSVWADIEQWLTRALETSSLPPTE